MSRIFECSKLDDHCMKSILPSIRVVALLLIVIVLPCSPESGFGAQANFFNKPATKPLDVITSYLQALHASDSGAAYRYISAFDRTVRDERTYIHSQVTFDGFALKLARWFAGEMKIWVIDRKLAGKKSHFEVGYRIPAGDEIASQLFDWNQTKLNALPDADQRRLITTLERLKGSGQMVMIEGQESLDLVREKNGWKVFLDWPARTRVIFKTRESNVGALKARFLRNDFLVADNEPFQIDFTVQNRSSIPLIVRLNHVIEPRRLTDNVNLIACGLSSPFTLEPQESRELSSSYIVGGNLSPRSQMTIIYDLATRTPPRRISGARASLDLDSPR